MSDRKIEEIRERWGYLARGSHPGIEYHDRRWFECYVDTPEDEWSQRTHDRHVGARLDVYDLLDEVDRLRTEVEGWASFAAEQVEEVKRLERLADDDARSAHGVGWRQGYEAMRSRVLEELDRAAQIAAIDQAPREATLRSVRDGVEALPRPWEEGEPWKS